MRIHCGYDIAYELPSPTAVILLLHLHPELDSRVVEPEQFRLNPELPCEEFIDGFGNRCVRLTAPAGLLEVSSDVVVEDSGLPAAIAEDAREHPVTELPTSVLPYLLPSRYCDVDLLGGCAWSLANLNRGLSGWARVQAVSNWVHGYLHFNYDGARATRTAHEALQERTGVCRDFTHLAIALCRCLNIPARYVTGYLGDIGVRPDPAPMDFSAWMEVYLGGRWHIFDVRHNVRRIGHLVVARGRDAADVAFTTTFGPHILRRFKVWTEQVASAHAAA